MIQVVVGIIQRNNKILVAKRPPDKPYSDYWEFPGGKIEKNETVVDALKRELNEELGIDVISAHPWFQHEHAYPDKTVFLNIFQVTDFLHEPQGRENQVLHWASPRELAGLRLLEGNYFIIQKIVRFFGGEGSII